MKRTSSSSKIPFTARRKEYPPPTHETTHPLVKIVISSLRKHTYIFLNSVGLQRLDCERGKIRKSHVSLILQ